MRLCESIQLSLLFSMFSCSPPNILYRSQTANDDGYHSGFNRPEPFNFPCHVLIFVHLLLLLFVDFCVSGHCNVYCLFVVRDRINKRKHGAKTNTYRSSYFIYFLFFCILNVFWFAVDSDSTAYHQLAVSTLDCVNRQNFLLKLSRQHLVGG